MFVLFLIIGFVSSVFLILLIWSWRAECYCYYDIESIKIKYKDFIKYYYLNPKEWNLKNLKYKCTHISFSLFDFYKFYSFRLEINKKIKNQKQNELKKIFLQDIQNDIDKVSKDANEKIRYAENIMKNIKLK